VRTRIARAAGRSNSQALPRHADSISNSRRPPAGHGTRGLPRIGSSGPTHLGDRIRGETTTRGGAAVASQVDGDRAVVSSRKSMPSHRPATRPNPHRTSEPVRLYASAGRARVPRRASLLTGQRRAARRRCAAGGSGALAPALHGGPSLSQEPFRPTVARSASPVGWRWCVGYGWASSRWGDGTSSGSGMIRADLPVGSSGLVLPG
jgi:hypothetical protein